MILLSIVYKSLPGMTQCVIDLQVAAFFFWDPLLPWVRFFSCQGRLTARCQSPLSVLYSSDSFHHSFYFLQNCFKIRDLCVSQISLSFSFPWFLASLAWPPSFLDMPL
jgi:hypothetical protein